MVALVAEFGDEALIRGVVAVGCEVFGCAEEFGFGRFDIALGIVIDGRADWREEGDPGGFA